MVTTQESEPVLTEQMIRDFFARMTDISESDIRDAYPSYAEALDSPPLTDEEKRSAFKKAMARMTNG